MNKSVLITEDEDGVAIFRHYYFCKQKKLPLETKLFNRYFFSLSYDGQLIYIHILQSLSVCLYLMQLKTTEPILMILSHVYRACKNPANGF